MRYALSQRLSFSTITYSVESGPVLCLILESMVYKLRSKMHEHSDLPIDRRVAYHMEHCNPEEITTRIQPFPTEVGESYKNGFDKLIPRQGIEITIEADVRT